jgi:hypothetical protein
LFFKWNQIWWQTGWNDDCESEGNIF